MAAIKIPMLKLLVSTLLLLFSSCSTAANDSMNKALLTALQKENLQEFTKLLEKGANPNALLGAKPEDWVMCEVMVGGRDEFLWKAVDYGGDINLRNSTPPLNDNILLSTESSPLGCAIYHNNISAFNFLMKKNVNLEINNCLDCKPWPGNEELNIGPRTNNTTPIDTALTLNHWEMVYKMIEKREQLRDQEINHLIMNIEEGRNIKSLVRLMIGDLKSYNNCEIWGMK